MKLSSAETLLFTRRLSDLTQGGLPLSRSLEILCQQSTGENLKKVLRNTKAELESGRSFSEALRGQKEAFSALAIGMIRSGESSGNLEAALNELANLLEKDMEARQKIRMALAYPAFLLLLAGGVCIFLLGFVIPRFQFLFEDLGQRLPFPTRLLIGVGHFLPVLGIVFVITAAIGGFFVVKNRAEALSFVQKKLFQIPVLSNLWRGALIQRWSSIMSSLLRSGYTVSDAVILSRQAMINPFFGNELREAARCINEGKSIKQALESSVWFSPMICELIGASEETGQIDQAFQRISDSTRRENEMHLKMLLSIMEPALILGMGAVVAFVALAMLLPIFEMSANLR